MIVLVDIIETNIHSIFRKEGDLNSNILNINQQYLLNVYYIVIKTRDVT